jgi:Fungal Zn(2)-Cys(6) binuclear cluster domain
MSLQPPEPNGANDTNRAEGLMVWSCVNCRRRKVRCDRRHPCAPCTRNKTECVFPVSGRIPRRGRDANYPNPPAQKQAELLGRLRRLEAMVGDLGSQVEHAAAVGQGNHPVESSTSATSATGATSSETATRDGVQAGSGMAKGTSELPQVSDEFGELVVASNGDIVVGNRFWTVFCKEVCSSSAPFCFALPTGVELGICDWRSNALLVLNGGLDLAHLFLCVLCTLSKKRKKRDHQFVNG